MTTTTGEKEATMERGSYSSVAKIFHWLTVLAVLFMLVTGFTMTYRGNQLDIWDALTNGLYSSHKLVGFTILWLTALRLVNRLIRGIPPMRPRLPVAQRVVAAATHWALYALLIVMPLLGWTAVSMFPALQIFDWFSLPALTAPDKQAYEVVAGWHVVGAFVLIFFAALHIGAALFHLVIKRDGVFMRMWPGR
ncbi:cytochrome B [Acuticoccus sediminis]|uniref:Cytochrome B n=1 Tax=Acuticoccus sediminis TaxID=2184697 RepID=A0A8B2NV48_9HYPH|nr:cytochrome b [Acuticoccus sediminis]RAI04048.1 cytochrome B [Acuticoccus sediminis]